MYAYGWVALLALAACTTEVRGASRDTASTLPSDGPPGGTNIDDDTADSVDSTGPTETGEPVDTSTSTATDTADSDTGDSGSDTGTTTSESDTGPSDTGGPGDTGIFPLDTGGPGDTGVFPTDTGGPGDTGTVPTETAVPGDTGTVPTESAVPGDTGTDSADTGPEEGTGDTAPPPDHDLDDDGYEGLPWGGLDCDDLDASIHPGVEDPPYDGVESNCEGAPEDDLEGDGYGIIDDCHDLDASIHPGAEDPPYDGVDSNCDGAPEDDLDGDGYGIADDCDDLDPTFHPGAPDVPYDGVDHGCDGEEDFDGDGFLVPDDCDDTDPDVFPGAIDVPYDGIDSDCAGDDDFDVDGDGFISDEHGGTDCDDNDASVYPGAVEVPNDGIDQDCDGADLVGDVGTFDDLVAGSLVITEIHHDSLAVDDFYGEWFEVWNATDLLLNLQGLLLLGAAPEEEYLIEETLWLEPGGFLLCARHKDPAINGGMEGVDVAYEHAIELITSDQLSLSTGGFSFVDVVNFGPYGIFSAEGTAVSLDPDHFAAAENGLKINWCPATFAFGLGDFGTPGEMNPECP